MDTTENEVPRRLPNVDPDGPERTQPLGEPRFRHDFSRIRLHPGAAAAQHQDDPLGSSNSSPTPAIHPSVNSPADAPQGLSGSPKVAELKVITDKTGAFSGFPVAKGIDLNVPGAFNDTKTTGSCVNVHQMQFRLSRGDPDEVKLVRKVIRVATAGGTEDRKGEKDKPADDGPSAGSVIRPKESSSVVVADAPGFIGKNDASKSAGVFPVSYDADFALYAIDAVQPQFLAKMEYTVSVSKKSFGDTAPTNEIKEKSRKLF